jgi:hypothetical protein
VFQEHSISMFLVLLTVQLQSSDNVLSGVLNFVEQRKPTTQVLAKQTKPVKKLLRKFDSLLIDNGILYRKISDNLCGLSVCVVHCFYCVHTLAPYAKKYCVQFG